MSARFSFVLSLMLLGLLMTIVLGPRVRVNTDWPADGHNEPLPSAAELDAYLKASEALAPNLVPGTEKTILWAREPGMRTQVALVYLHGFSSSRQEARPLMEEVAAGLGANLFYARLRGHGRTGEALAAVQLEDWQQDAWEALAIGRRLGERVVLVGVSNGGTLATWLATQPGAADLSALVLLSPNYGPRDPLSELLLWPWARVLVRTMIGKEYHWTPRNPEHARYWTSRYPSRALLTMMGAVKLARKSPLERLRAPLLLLYAPEDRVVDSAKTERLFPRFGAQDKLLLPLANTSDPQHHALAGDILAPADTARVCAAILDFLVPRVSDGAKVAN